MSRNTYFTARTYFPYLQRVFVIHIDLRTVTHVNYTLLHHGGIEQYCQVQPAQ